MSLYQFRLLYKKVKKYFTKKSVAAIVALVVSCYYLRRAFKGNVKEVKLSQFLSGLSQNIINEVVVSGTKLLFKLNHSNTWYSTNAHILTEDRIFKLVRQHPQIEFSCEDPKQKLDLINLSILGFCYFLGYKAFRTMNQDRNQHPRINDEYTSNVKFSDVYGLEGAKKEFLEIIDYLKDPKKYRNIGARLRRGILLYGPSGTGKTLLAKATAGEANVKFINCTASEFVEIYVGVGPKRVRELFQKARQLAPCILFIDEIDGVGQRRKNSKENGEDAERSSTLNQLLTEMDGFKEIDNVVVIAATNRVLQIDDALLRSGRFDTKIKVDLPNQEERKGIIKIHLKNKQQCLTEEAIEKVARDSDGMSGADLENIVNECAYSCIYDKREMINDEDLLKSYRKIASQKPY